jgi:hypothetical protein
MDFGDFAIYLRLLGCLLGNGTPDIALPSPGLGAFQEVAQKLLLFSSLILTTLLFLGVRSSQRKHATTSRFGSSRSRVIDFPA